MTTRMNVRESYWDTVKAFLIFLVILGHVIQFFMYQSVGSSGFWSDPIFKGIYLFHMPLFVLVSGYFAAKSISKYSWRSVPRYFQRLSLPCLSMGILFLILSVIKGQISIFAFYNGCTVLWFLIVIFECLLCVLLMGLSDSLLYKVIAFIAPILFAMIIVKAPFLSFLGGHIQQFIYLWPFFVLGTVLSLRNFSNRHINWRWGGFLVLFVVLYIYFQPTWYVYRFSLEFEISSFLINIFRTAAAISGCGVFLWMCKYLHSFIGKYAIIGNIGKSTLAVYVLQTIFFCEYELISACLPDKISYIFAILLSIVLLLLLYLTYKVTRKTPIIACFLYGENKS